jgi:DNA polymerase
MRAPPGYKLIVCDASQIEARILAWLAGEHELLKQFASGDDVYARFAEVIYGYKISKLTHPSERVLGKEGVLSLGYNCGHEKFFNRVRLRGADVTRKQTDRVVDAYRERFTRITNFWRECHNAMHSFMGLENPRFLPSWAKHEALIATEGGLKLPNTTRVQYHDLQYDQVSREWTFQHRGTRAKLYGGKVVEHGTQALARIVVSDAWERLANLGHQVVLQVHDELVLVAREEHALHVREDTVREFCRVPAWAPGLPLAADAAVVDRYGEAK